MPSANEMRILLADNQAGTTNPISIAARNCNLLGNQVFGSDPGKRGTRQQFACGARLLREDCVGGFNLYPTVTQLDWLIERMIGDNISGYPAGAATPKETLPPIYAYVDKGDEIFRYDELRVATIGISIRSGDYIDFRFDFIGKDETNGVTWPGAAPAIDCASEFVASDVAFNYDATAYNFKTLDLSIDNSILEDQHENALKRTLFEAGDLVVNFSTNFGYRVATKALYRAGIAGAAASVVVGDGTTTYTIAIGNLKIPGPGPIVPDTGEITMSPNMMGYRTAAAQQIQFTKV